VRTGLCVTRYTAMGLQYVILHHTDVAEPHYDLMFEAAPGGALRTFRSPAWPIEEATVLTPLPDHRRAYLTYEGPVSGGRGSVRRVEAGTYTAEPSLNEEAGSFQIQLLPARRPYRLVRDPHWIIEPAPHSPWPSE
jgi:hypothetical protein